MRKRVNIDPIKIRDEMVVAAVEVGGSKTKVANTFGISRGTLYRIIERVKRDAPIISSYRAIRAEVNAYNQLRRQEKQEQVIENITEDEIKGADLKTKMVVLDTLGKDKEREFEQERLERGQSTENIAMIVAEIRELKRKKGEQRKSGAIRGEVRV